MTFRVGKHSGGGGSVGTAEQAAPAHPGYTVGAVGFGPQFDDDDDGWVRLTDKGWKSMTDSMAASIVRLECEAEELRAGAALAEAERSVLKSEIKHLQNTVELYKREVVRLQMEAKQ